MLDQKKVSKKNQEIAKVIAINCDRQTKAKMSPRLQHFLTLLFDFAAPISFSLITILLLINEKYFYSIQIENFEVLSSIKTFLLFEE